MKMKTDVSTLCKVLDRVERDIPALRHDRISLTMDLESVPDLDLEGLLTASPLDFTHDICGIVRHMDRSSFPGKLTDCFVPRYCR